MRLHAVDPRILPWPAGTKMIEVNKHILTEDHFFFQNCFGGIWTYDYDVNPKGWMRTVDMFDALCREHERVKVVQPARQIC
jgi:hypothetical protein